jgi:adenylate cyclase
MASEIERKFLVRRDFWTPLDSGILYRQGYLSSATERVVRVRIAGSKAFLTVKGITTGVTRMEFEYEISVADAATMLDRLCERPLIEKTRHREMHAGNLWEIDVFHGDNDGLVVAEIELPSSDASFERPVWLGPEVSDDPRYYNSNLGINPYRNWKPAAS